MKQYNSIQV